MKDFTAKQSRDKGSAKDCRPLASKDQPTMNAEDGILVHQDEHPNPSLDADRVVDAKENKEQRKNWSCCSDRDFGEEKEDRIKQRRRNCLLLFASLYTFFFSGAYFGWGPMQLLLEENGSCASKCTLDEQEKGEICPSQSAALVRIHFVGTMSQFVSPILGELVDRYGPAVLSYLMGTCGCVGVALLIVAAQSEIDWLLFAAFLTIANSTWMVSTSAFFFVYLFSITFLFLSFCSYREHYCRYGLAWSFKGVCEQG